MDLNYTPEEESFRADVRAFLAAELPPEIRDKVNLGRRMRKDDLVRWQKILYHRGWGAGMWPKSFGGGRRRTAAAAVFVAYGCSGVDGVRERRAAGLLFAANHFGRRLVVPGILR